MATDKQLAANRLNAQLSTGPKNGRGQGRIQPQRYQARPVH